MMKDVDNLSDYKICNQNCFFSPAPPTTNVNTVLRSVHLEDGLYVVCRKEGDKIQLLVGAHALLATNKEALMFWYYKMSYFK